MKKLIKIVLYFFNANKVFSKPKEKKILIFDRAGSELFLRYFNLKDVEIFDIRGESINIYLLFKTFIKMKFDFISYASEYLECVQPKLVLTFIDNDISFYTFKDIYPNAQYIAVQNGCRGGGADIFGRLSDYSFKNQLKADFILVHNDNMGKLYKKYIQCRTLSIGSFKNNILCDFVKNKIVSNKILFISQYRKPIGKYMYRSNITNSDILWEDFYKPEKLLLKMLQAFCVKNNFKIVIAGASADKEEYNFYDDILQNSNWEFIAKSGTFSSYNLIANYQYIVDIDSTLGFEAISTAKRVVFFTCREQFINDKELNFLWYSDVKDKGLIWTNELSQNEFNRLINVLIYDTEDVWDSILKDYKNDIMAFDKHNSQFINLITQLKIPLIKED
jgi:surface carbohydrate biosynthesis protein